MRRVARRRSHGRATAGPHSACGGRRVRAVAALRAQRKGPLPDVVLVPRQDSTASAMPSRRMAAPGCAPTSAPASACPRRAGTPSRSNTRMSSTTPQAVTCSTTAMATARPGFGLAILEVGVMDPARVAEAVRKDGYCVVENVLAPPLVRGAAGRHVPRPDAHRRRSGRGAPAPRGRDRRAAPDDEVRALLPAASSRSGGARGGGRSTSRQHRHPALAERLHSASRRRDRAPSVPEQLSPGFPPGPQRLSSCR